MVENFNHPRAQCTTRSLPEDGPEGPKHIAEVTEHKILSLKHGVHCVGILLLYVI
jgi:hypothetical protein